MLLESDLLREDTERYVLTGPLTPVLIPDTLQGSLMARLDQLHTAKEVAQLGAALGREFSYDLLHAISSQDEETLRAGLARLVAAELLYQRGRPPQAKYIFKHALIQDVAYGSLLRSTRQQVHQQIARQLETRFPDTVEAHPELLAHHYTEAGLVESAIPYWQQAGQYAMQRSAYIEAEKHLHTGLTLLRALPETSGWAQQALDLHRMLADTQRVIRGSTAPAVGEGYAP
jgi:predicted ATPase